MATLEPGSKAPAIELPLLNGGTFSLANALAKGRVALAFFKVSCPICQYSFPYYERLAQNLNGKAFTMVGISQDDAKSTAEFTKRFGVTFPIALDLGKGYPVSSAYGLTNVPTLLLINEDGEIEEAVIGWSKQGIEKVHERFRDSQTASVPLFAAGENVADFKAG